MIDCVVNLNTGDGISIGYGGIVRSCVATINGDDGIVASDNACRISDCSSALNTGDGIELLEDSFVSNNKVDGNITGILVTGADNRIDGNSVTDNAGDGIRVTGTGNLIIRNTASGNASDYNCAAGNSNAQVLNPVAGFVSTDPWANISY